MERREPRLGRGQARDQQGEEGSRASSSTPVLLITLHPSVPRSSAGTINADTIDKLG